MPRTDARPMKCTGEASAPLMLPRGASTVVVGDERDLAVLAVLRGLNGSWEPHVRRFLEHTVQADWVCLDIGANIGAHTLAMASMATEGMIVAFEASSENFGYLSRNVANLPAPKAQVKLVKRALWNEPGRLNIRRCRRTSGLLFRHTLGRCRTK